MTPEVSVIVPVYDSGDTLDRCLRSVLSQTLQNIEIILVDDGSTDDSAEICDDFGREDGRVAVVHQANGGLSDARNAGLAIATGEYIAFLDSDDWAESNMLVEMVAAARATASDVVVAGSIVDVVDAQDRLLATRRTVPGSGVLREGSPPGAITDDLINLLGYAWNKLYRRKLLEEASCEFTVGLSLIEDMIFNGRALTQASSTVLVDAAFVHYVQRPGETLGKSFFPDFLTMRLRAIDTVGVVLEHWGAQSSDISVELGRLRVGAVRALATRTSALPNWSLLKRAAHFRQARRQADAPIREAELGGRLRLEFRLLRSLPAVSIMLGYAVRRRFSRVGRP